MGTSAHIVRGEIEQQLHLLDIMIFNTVYIQIDGQKNGLNNIDDNENETMHLYHTFSVV